MATVMKMPEPAAAGFANADRFIQAAIALRPLLQRDAAEGERLRRPTDAVDKALKDNNLLTLLLPRRWGGGGI